MEIGRIHLPKGEIRPPLRTTIRFFEEHMWAESVERESSSSLSFPPPPREISRPLSFII